MSENAFYVDPYVRYGKSSFIFDLIGLKPIAFGTIEQPVNQSDCGIAVGQYAGYWNQGTCAIAIGEYAGNTSQGQESVSVGVEAGRNNQGEYSVALGSEAGRDNQSSKAVAIGHLAGQNTQGFESIAIGSSAGWSNQGHQAIAIGTDAGLKNQSSYAISIGTEAGQSNQGSYAIAIGYQAGYTNQTSYSIILNASGAPLNASNSGFYVAPIRPGSSGQILYYNPVTDEIFSGGVPGGTIPSGTYHGDYLHWDSDLVGWSLGTSQISLGRFAGDNNQSIDGTALGFHAGEYNQSTCAVAIGHYAGQTDQSENAIAIGCKAGSNAQGTSSIAIGINAGQTNQAEGAVAVGVASGNQSQQSFAVAVGNSSGLNEQGTAALALGLSAGQDNQGQHAIAIGIQAGQTNQEESSISIGSFAGQNNQGTNAIAIGQYAGQTNQPQNSIILNASGSTMSGTTQSGFYVNPIRTGSSSNALFYDTTTREILQGSISANIIPDGINYSDYLYWNGSDWLVDGNRVHLGTNAGQTSQFSNAIALGVLAGNYSQGTNAIAIGQYAGQTNQPQNSIILNASGSTFSATQSGFYVNPIRTGSSSNALFYDTTTREILQGSISANIIPDGINYSDYLYWNGSDWLVDGNRVHLGTNAGQTSQFSNAIALGVLAGNYSQGTNAIAIGQYAGQTNQPQNSIILNASGSTFSATQSGFYVNPVRNTTGSQALFYEPSTREITYSNPSFSNLSLQTYTYSYFQARDAVIGKFMLTDCADKDAFYRLRVSEPVTLFEGSTIYDSSSVYFDNDLTTNASITGPNNSATMILTVNAGAVQNQYAARQSHFYAHYQPGKSFLSMMSFSFGPAVAGIAKRVGMYDVDNANTNNPLNGILLEQTTSGLTWYLYKGDGTSQSAAQAAWNVDPLNGSGPSGFNLTTLKAEQNLLAFVDLEWLGVGRVRVGLFINGVPVICNVFNNNGFSVPYLNNPLLPIRYEVRRIVNTLTAAASINAICCSIMSEGGFDPIGVVRTFQSGQLSLSNADIKYSLAIRLRSGYPRAIISPISLEMVSDLTGGANVAYYSIYLWRPSSNAIPSSTTWSNVSGVLGGSGSFVEYSNPGQSGATDLYDQMNNDTTGVRLLIQRGSTNSTSKTSLSVVSNALLIAQSSVDKTNRDIYLIVINNNSTGNGVKYTSLFTWREI